MVYCCYALAVAVLLVAMLEYLLAMARCPPVTSQSALVLVTKHLLEVMLLWHPALPLVLVELAQFT